MDLCELCATAFHLQATDTSNQFQESSSFYTFLFYFEYWFLKLKMVMWSNKIKLGRIRWMLYSCLVPSAPWPRLLEEHASVSPPSPGLLRSRHSQNRNRISQSWACEMKPTPESQLLISSWLQKLNSTLQGFYWCTRSNSRGWGHIR